jgi:hypothetical protein
MTKAEFAAALAELKRDQHPKDENPGSYRSTECERSINCMFCQGCTDCYRCTHCIECSGVTGSSHCVRCVGCHDCSHCEDSEACTGSAYLIQCSSCIDCTYCYGCVGLTKKEFHILNVAYSRTEYFALLKTLRKESL